MAAAAAVGSGMTAVVAAVAAGLEAECAAAVVERMFGDRCWRTAFGAEEGGMSHGWARTAAVVEGDRIAEERSRGRQAVEGRIALQLGLVHYLQNDIDGVNVPGGG